LNVSENTNPIINQLNGPFWNAGEQGLLALPYCPVEQCAFWPPSPISPFGGGSVEWRETSPHGILRASVIYRRAFLKSFDAAMPFAIGLVRLDCGPQLQVHIRDPDGNDAPATGDRVTLGFESVLPGGRAILVARLSRS
jgi:uncharacterized OB-fold protein